MSRYEVNVNPYYSYIDLLLNLLKDEIKIKFNLNKVPFICLPSECDLCTAL